MFPWRARWRPVRNSIVDEVCKCHLVSCKQFVHGSDAISAIERKATLWIDDRATRSRSSDVAAALLS